ncbi:hypothetical protein BDY21DRAFT_363440 [Lineolata rhizophorae]|uniref:Uncharacterized protein n=1 Tax=Lineolata rhizophorae TaxID=578093 RepID=A0A6A6P1F5_9PEZI|nr:hypothetical protein BDY21DRAFT_363440 [Lineolata rhizophorae]
MSPLSPLSSNVQNAKGAMSSPAKSAHVATDTPKSPNKASAASLGEDDVAWADAPSSPFIEEVGQENQSQVGGMNNMSQSQQLHSQHDTTTWAPHQSQDGSSSSQMPKEARDQHSRHHARSKLNSDALVLSITDADSEDGRPAVRQDKALRDNEGLTTAVKLMEMEREGNASDSSEIPMPDETNIDDTCFSTFSEVPTDMTTLARLGCNSPSKTFRMGQTPSLMATPATVRKAPYASTERSLSPTPRGHAGPRPENDTTNLLLDFTEQMESFSTSSRRSPTRTARTSPLKSQGEPKLLSYINDQRSPSKRGQTPRTPTEKKNILNLLDFELPPAPTPRSVPTITIRELESLKSSYLSQISSLNATLSGREAEVESLKKAVGDAERRVGEAMENVREEKCAREHVEKEKAEWEKRGIEVEEVLKSIKKEIICSEKEKEELARKLEEADRKAEDAEARAVEAETRAIEAEGRVPDTSELPDNGANSGPKFTAEQVQKQLDEKVATLCRELHTVYKKKHETKVAALKKGYEAKSEKKLVEMQRTLDQLSKQHEELKLEKNATLSGVLPSDLPTAEQTVDRKLLEKQKAEIEEQKAKLAGLAEELRAMRCEHTDLLQALQQERVEKGELVAAVDEMLALQAEAGTPAAVDDFRRSISKPSGLRGPGFTSASTGGESKIGRPLPSSGLSRSVSGSKSRIMSNIERMGSGRAMD